MLGAGPEGIICVADQKSHWFHLFLPSFHRLNVSATYCFHFIRWIEKPGDLPNNLDVLRSRVGRTRITKTVFVNGGLKYWMFDVGAQRSKRKKWICWSQNVTAIVFLVAAGEYDQMLYENWSVFKSSFIISPPSKVNSLSLYFILCW
jgi:hypothetical protein